MVEIVVQKDVNSVMILDVKCAIQILIPKQLLLKSLLLLDLQILMLPITKIVFQVVTQVILETLVVTVLFAQLLLTVENVSF